MLRFGVADDAAVDRSSLTGYCEVREDAVTGG